MADRIVSSGSGQCLLIVVQDLHPTGRSMACTRFGYKPQKFSATKLGEDAENLFLIAIPDGIASKAKTPVTVYLTGTLDGGRICGYSVLHHGKRLSNQTRSTIRNKLQTRLFGCLAKHQRSAGVFCFGSISPSDI